MAVGPPFGGPGGPLNASFTGKAATFTVKLPDYRQSQSVTLKSNGFLVVNFTL